MEMSSAVCVACHRTIDAAARLCPYCGADPESGQKIDTQALLLEEFRPRQLTKSESVLEYARHRQGTVVAVAGIVAFLLLAAVHRYVTVRNERAVANAQALPLTEIADLSNQPDETKPQAMPELDFQYEGKPQTFRTFIVEAGAVVPPAVIAAQQAEALAKQQQAAQGGSGAQPQQAAPQPQAPMRLPATALPPTATADGAAPTSANGTAPVGTMTAPNTTQTLVPQNPPPPPPRP